MRPRLVADDEVEPAGLEQRAERAPNTAYPVGPRETNLAQH
jgi:hypothetical protein